MEQVGLDPNLKDEKDVQTEGKQKKCSGKANSQRFMVVVDAGRSSVNRQYSA